MIDQSKTYRTRDGREVRIYATDGANEDYPVHGATLEKVGWIPDSWTKDGRAYISPKFDRDKDLIESDPHGILPRHRELLASVYAEQCPGTSTELDLLGSKALGALHYDAQVALIALARLDGGSKESVSP